MYVGDNGQTHNVDLFFLQSFIILSISHQYQLVLFFNFLIKSLPLAIVTHCHRFNKQ